MPILVWNRVWFTKELRLCINVFVVSIPNVYKFLSQNKKERVTCELEMAFKKSFVAVLISGMMTSFLFYVDSGVAFCDHLQV